MDRHNKKRRCLELVREVSTAFPQLALPLVPVDENYERYVFDGHLMDSLRETSWKGSSPENGQYFQDLLPGANSTEQDVGACFIDREYCVTGASCEEYVEAGIKVACAIVRSTGGTLSSFNPLDWCKE